MTARTSRIEGQDEPGQHGHERDEERSGDLEEAVAGGPVRQDRIDDPTGRAAWAQPRGHRRQAGRGHLRRPPGLRHHPLSRRMNARSGNDVAGIPQGRSVGSRLSRSIAASMTGSSGSSAVAPGSDRSAGLGSGHRHQSVRISTIGADHWRSVSPGFCDPIPWTKTTPNAVLRDRTSAPGRPAAFAAEIGREDARAQAWPVVDMARIVPQGLSRHQPEIGGRGPATMPACISTRWSSWKRSATPGRPSRRSTPCRTSSSRFPLPGRTAGPGEP